MGVWEALMWGSLGGMLVDFLQLIRILRRHGYNIPPPFRKAGYWLGAVFRIAIGGILAVAISRDSIGPVAAIAIGISGPAVIEKLSRSDLPLV